MRTGIRSVAPKYVKHIHENRKALGGHKLGRWSPTVPWSPDIDLGAEDARFKANGGDGLCASCRRVAGTAPGEEGLSRADRTRKAARTPN